VVDTDQKTPGRNDSCQPRWARLIIFLNKACVIEDSKNSGNGRYGNFPRALVWSLPSPNSNEQALHETKRCDVTNDDEDVHFYSITKQANFQKLQNSTILTVAVVTFSFSKNFTIACHRSTPSPFSPICDRQTFQISSLYAIEKGFSSSDFSSEISCNKNLRTSKSPIPRISSYDVTDYEFRSKFSSKST